MPTQGRSWVAKDLSKETLINGYIMSLSGRFADCQEQISGRKNWDWVFDWMTARGWLSWLWAILIITADMDHHSTLSGDEPGTENWIVSDSCMVCSWLRCYDAPMSHPPLINLLREDVTKKIREFPYDNFDSPPPFPFLFFENFKVFVQFGSKMINIKSLKGVLFNLSPELFKLYLYLIFKLFFAPFH